MKTRNPALFTKPRKRVNKSSLPPVGFGLDSHVPFANVLEPSLVPPRYLVSLFSDDIRLKNMKRQRVDSARPGAGVAGTREGVGTCRRRLPSWGRLVAAPVAAPPRASRHVALRRPCRMPRHPMLSRRPCVLHCDVHREGRVRRAPHSVPCPPPTVPSRFSLACQRSGWAALSRRASLKCVAHWSSFSPDFQLRVPVPLGDHGILSQRTQVCVVFRDSGVLASSTRALVVSAVPLDDLRHSFFFLRCHVPLWGEATGRAPGNATRSSLCQPGGRN